MNRFGYRLVVCVIALGSLAACEESTAVPPTAPSSLPTDKVAVLTLTCPADVVIQSQAGPTAQVFFPAPQLTGGLAPRVDHVQSAVGRRVSGRHIDGELQRQRRPGPDQ